MSATGELGLPYSVAGSVLQALANVLVERGHDKLGVIVRLSQWAPDHEIDFWDDYIYRTVNDLEVALGLDPIES